MDKKGIELKKKIIAKRDIVRQKLKALKEGEIYQEESFSPITKRLQTIAEKLDVNQVNLKREPEDVKDEFSFKSPKGSSSPKPNRRAEPSFIEAPVIAEYTSNVNNDDDDHDSSESIREVKEYIQTMANSPLMASYLELCDPLPREYIHEMIADVDNKFDFTYGVRYDIDSNELKIGNSPIQLDGKDLIIGGLTYKGTPGLYELLFKKHPVGFTGGDRITYLNIVKRTNAHRINFSAEGRIKGNGSYKYKHIISALNTQAPTPRKSQTTSLRRRLGYGMLMEASDSPIDYVHWDDPNELVERLRLLVASQTAGHTGHTNEIASIIEELRESKIIA